MLIEQSIANYLSLQPYEYISTEIAEDGKQSLLHLKSNKETEDVQCPYCNGHVHICGNYSIRLRDMPVYPGTRLLHKTFLALGYFRHASVPWDKAGCGGKLPPLPLPEMHEDLL